MALHRHLLPILLLTALLLSACTPAPRQKPDDGGPDIRSLEEPGAVSSAPSETTAAPEPGVDPQQEAVEHYQRFVELAPGNQASELAQQRIADLQLEGAGAGGNASKSIEIYEQILRDQPESAGNSRILYQLARAYEADGQLEKSLATLEIFTRRYPDAPEAQEARFRSAELLFALQRYREAELYYVQHYRYGEKSPYYEPALYKLGWCHYKQSQYAEALANFYRVLERYPQAYRTDSTTLNTADLDRARREMLDDSLRGISLSYAALGDANAAQPELARLNGKPYELLVNERLVRHYLEKQRFSDAAQTLQAFAQRHPQHPRAAAMLTEAIDIYARGDFPSQVVAGKQAYVQRFSTQAGAQAADPAVRGRVDQYRREVARYRFDEAQRTQREVDVRAAVDSYRDVLGNASDSAESSQMRFQLAEQLYRSGQFAAAAEEYERVAYGAHPGANGAAAAYGLTLAWQHAADKQSETVALGARKNFISSALRLAERYPAHPEKATVLTRSAEELLKLKDLPQAAAVARRAVQASSQSPEPLRYSVWSVVAAAEFQLGHDAEAETAYRELLRLSPANDPRRVDHLRGLAAALYRQGESRKKAGDLRAAADIFLRVGQAAPESDIRATADYDAGAAFIALKDWPRAIQVLEGFRNRYPQHPLQQDVGRKLAVAYTENGQKDKAALEFASIASKGSRAGDDPGLRQEAAWQAAELHAQAGQSRQAIAAYEKFLLQFPQAFERGIEARQRLIEMDVGNTPKLRERQRALIDADRNAGTKRSERSRYLAAKASLSLADAERETFQRIALKAPLEQSLRAKKTQMEKALAGYARAADYNIAEVTTAATCHLGEIYLDLSRALLDSPRPRGLSAEEQTQYKLLLEEQAFPFEEKAIEIHETNIRRASNGVYDVWVQRSYDALARIAPARFGKTERGDDLVQALR